MSSDVFRLAVCGAHLSGMPLNHQLLELEGVLEKEVYTAPKYRFFALAGDGVAKPGMFFSPENGNEILMEIWRLPMENVGRFLMNVPWPLSIGKILTNEDEYVHGFLCDRTQAVQGEEITHLGSWRVYQNQK